MTTTTTIPTIDELADELNLLRQHHGITFGRVASEAGLSRLTISAVANRRLKNPKLSTVTAIRRATERLIQLATNAGNTL